MGCPGAACRPRELPEGLSVWDQWQGRPVRQRVIPFRGGSGRATNGGDRFYVVAAEGTRGRVSADQICEFCASKTCPMRPNVAKIAPDCSLAYLMLIILSL